MPDWVISIFAALSLLALACSLFTWRRGAPQQLFDTMETLNDNQQKLAEAFDGLSSNIAAFKLDVDAQLEAMERVAGQVERTRRQHAARDSKKKEPDKPPEDEFGLPINNPDLRRARLEALVRK